MLKVININSPINLKNHDLALVEQVIHLAEKSRGWKYKNSLSYLLDKVPVFLLNDKKMPDWRIEYDEERGSEEKNTEYLGFYLRLVGSGGGDIPNIINDFPAIFICPERIFLCAQNRDYQVLLTNVIIHEFAHAIMDQNHENRKTDTSTRFYRWVEEPFANWFVLRYFYSYGNGNLFQEVTRFIKNQPKNYRLGSDLFEANIPDNLWEKWARKKSKINSSVQDNWLFFAKNRTPQDPQRIKDEFFKVLQ